MYAANIADLTAHAQNPVDVIPMAALKRVLDYDPASAIECERGKVTRIGHGCLFVCPDEQALAVIQIIRQRYKKHQWRFYEKTGRGWKRI